MESQATRGVSKLLFFAESNYGGVSRAAEAFIKIRAWSRKSPYRVHCILAHDKSRTQPGFWLDDTKKERMAIETKSVLERDSLMLAEDFVAPAMGAKAALEKVFTQLMNYERRFKETLSRSGAVTEDSRTPYKYSGKTTSDSDDVVIILQETLLLTIYNQQGYLRYTDDLPTHMPTILNPRITKKGTVEDVYAGRRQGDRYALMMQNEPEIGNFSDHADDGADIDRDLINTDYHYVIDEYHGRGGQLLY